MKIKKTISLPCYQRPEILRQVLDSLKSQMVDLDEYTLYISCEPGNEQVIDIIKSIDFIKTDIVINSNRIGINSNTFAPIRKAFDKGSDFNLYWEDDIILCPDALNLFEWYTAIDLTNIAQLDLCNLWDKRDVLNENLIYKSRRMCGWGFVVTKWQFEKYFVPAWFPRSGCWDNSSARHVRTFKGVYNIVPQLSRSTNIGIFGNQSNMAIWSHQMKGHRYNTKRKKFDYYLQAEPEYE